MNRNIVTNGDVETAGGADTEDGNWQRLIKYIPAETIGAYIASEGLVKTLLGSGEKSQRIGLIVLFVALASFNWLYLRMVAKVMRPVQITISTIAFAIYVFAIGGFWASFSWWKSGWGSLAVIGFALLAVFVKPTAPMPKADELPAADLNPTAAPAVSPAV